MEENHLISAVQESRYRLTKQRSLLLKVLSQSQEHLEAEALYEQAKALDPNVSLATVYRTLAMLKELGLVVEHRLGEDHAHFEPVKDHPHYHFTCQHCGQIIEFHAPEVEQVVQDLRENEGLQINDIHLFLTGYCSRCKDRSDKHDP
jgi:Fe2+ or Zn2+ uptake regulation protein